MLKHSPGLFWHVFWEGFHIHGDSAVSFPNCPQFLDFGGGP